MDSSHDDFAFARITSAKGSVVTIPFLTDEQADDVAAQYGPVAEPVPPSAASDDQEESCRQCGGQGGWYEDVKVTTPSGGEVVTKKWVNCRPCGSGKPK